jgi:hypothetical protein
MLETGSSNGMSIFRCERFLLGTLHLRMLTPLIQLAIILHRRLPVVKLAAGGEIEKGSANGQ